MDYITIYRHEAEGANGKNTSLHWHYISCGFSDLYGDGRVHEYVLTDSHLRMMIVILLQTSVSNPDQPSGFGFELTFRLQSENMSPPAWPAELMQSLARYVFSSGNILCVGDHISWNASLDKQESRIQHMLLAADAQLPLVKSALGYIHFLQIVGVTAEEVTAAQSWNGMGVLKLMKASAM